MKWKCIKMDERIESVFARQIFDSRGTPTVEAMVVLNNGVAATAAVPSGASTGQYEACELRDQNEEYGGKGVLKAVDNVNTKISEALKGELIFEQYDIDKAMIDLDGTENKSKLGANAILAVSLACARAGAICCDMPLYNYLGGINAVTLPVPMMNILNGGAHANNNIDIQEFMIVPTGAKTFEQAMQYCVDTYHTLGKLLKDKGLNTTVGDEGGFAPNLDSDENALELICDAINKSGFVAGKDIKIALDAATSEWQTESGYMLPKKKEHRTKDELISYFNDLRLKYPIISIEDPLSENDFEGFKEIKEQLGIQIVGDDLFVTNPKRLQTGIEQKSANAILIKPNQIGTLSETMQTIRLAKRNGYKTIISHRSGETGDAFIADLAVALNAEQIKTGAPARSERLCKYNRLLQIEIGLGQSAVYPGELAFK